MEIKHTRFGPCLIEEHNVFVFPRSIYGFANLTEYALVPLPKVGEPFYILLSLEKDNLCFITREIPQTEWQMAYRSKMSLLSHAIHSLGLKDEIPSVILMATFTPDRSYELNWLAPIIVSKRLGKAWQMILDA